MYILEQNFPDETLMFGPFKTFEEADKARAESVAAATEGEAGFEVTTNNAEKLQETTGCPISWSEVRYDGSSQLTVFNVHPLRQG